MNFYQVCSNDPPWVKTGPSWGGGGGGGGGVDKLEHRNKEGKLQNSSSLKLEGLDL